MNSERWRVDVRGIVQGIGFRPFVYTLATRFQLTGAVWNHSSGVSIEIEGPLPKLDAFVAALTADAPPLARIDEVQSAKIPSVHSTAFSIITSTDEDQASTPVSPDVAICDACLKEMRDPDDRRHNYPFINCTNCGPRFTIILDVPYDRPQTTMAPFSMCEECTAEYRDPANRRFHAQPNACPKCGPRVWFVSSEQKQIVEQGGGAAQWLDGPRKDCLADAQAIAEFHQAIKRGHIVAVKGVGGFHLACDATNDAAVARLRDRKGRSGKPLAIMVESTAAAQRFAKLSRETERLLMSRQRPIVLLPRHPATGVLSDLVAPGNDDVGVMLPYSPLHHLLVRSHAALVMTSGNLSEEPIARDNYEAVDRLGVLADSFLLHDRPIHVSCDDSVVRVFEGQELPIRRSRGYAPVPVRLSATGPSVLAVGAELKATFCVTKNDYAYMSQHLGDMANSETLAAMERSVEHFCGLFRATPVAIARDMHPGYLSTMWADAYAKQMRLPVIAVQHHHAHIAGLRAEHHCSEPVIGICFDGTGYGEDGAIWGGEILRVDDAGSQRLAHLRYSPLPGGDASIRRPYRTALAHLWSAGIEWSSDLPCVQACPKTERRILATQLERNFNCVPTSSMGRLFDAVASLIGVRHEVTYEAQAVMEMEAMATFSKDAAALGRDPGDPNPEGYAFAIFDAQNEEGVDPAPVLARIVSDLRAQVPVSVIAGRFHAAVADAVCELCVRFRSDLGLNEVGLSGGVFQNVLLLDHTVRRLRKNDFHVLIHRQTPPNDGGIALGQAVIARRAT